MWTKGVLLLGFIACWTVLCNGEDGFLYDYGIGDALSKELAEDYLLRADVTCIDDSECNDKQECVGEEGEKKCQCHAGLSGDDCGTLDWCDGDEGKFKDCKDENGECKYSEEDKSVVCICDNGKKLHPSENICKACDCGSNGTCSFDESTGDKKCNCKDKTAVKDGKCIETCTEESECQYNGKCKKDGENSFCSCETGLIGDKCQIVADCIKGGEYELCRVSGGECTFDGGKAVCRCPGIKKFDEKDKICKPCDCGTKGTCGFENGEKKCACDEGTSERGGKCIETCTEDTDCKNDMKCSKEGDKKFCNCMTGLGGDKCEIVLDCVGEGLYKGCKASGGECTFDGEKAVCTCSGDKKLDDKNKVCKSCDCGPKGKCSFENGEKKCACDEGTAEQDGKCIETCTEDADCQNDMKCSKEDGDKKFCDCKTGLVGDKCEIVTDCVGNGQYKGCKASGGKCSFDGEKAVCTCSGNKKLNDTAKTCQTCDCGRKGTCSFEKGVKKCDCDEGFGDKNGTCAETCEEVDCEHETACEKSGDFHFCKCTDGLSGDKCDIIDECVTGKFRDCKSDKGECGYDLEKKEAVCNCDGKMKLDSKLNYCLECDCGENAECSIQNKVKTCTCNKGYLPKDDKCIECNCGEKGRCTLDDNGKKKCTCYVGYAENNGVCKECNCGNYGNCSFEGGEKKCTCNKNYSFKESNGKCEICNCGTGGTCHFEGDTKKCTCNEGYLLWNEQRCTECDCGEHGECSLNDKGKKTCDCASGYGVKKVNGKDTCVEICQNDNDCEHQGKCEGPDDGDKFCFCKSALEGDKCEVIIDCVRRKFKDCVKSGGECGIDELENVFCKCPDAKKLDPLLDICRDKCSAEKDCKNGAKCEEDLCQCPEGTKGDDCSIKTLCETLKCEDKDATCEYDASKNPNTFCVCKKANYMFVDNKCVEKCKPKDYCQNGGTCNSQTNKCDCLPNTSGDKCQTITGCKTLECDKINAECDYDTKSRKATCKCKEANHYYENKKCNPQWCKDACDPKISTCEYSDGMGVCKCKTAGTSYNYATKKCTEIDTCFNKTCESGFVCKNGACSCPDNYKLKDKKCEPVDLCKPNKCFTGALCDEGSSIGYVKCYCNSSASKFYLPRGIGKCEDGSCFLPGADRKNCPKTKACPPGMSRTDGECKYKKEEDKCDQDCGFLGWCFKHNETAHICRCDPNYAEIKTETGKCVLKASAVCPYDKKDGDNKCKCEGKYKDSENKITCELKSCSDEEVQNECKRKKALKCVDDWLSGYKCECPTGYVLDSKGNCIDPCSQQKAIDRCASVGQKCYIGDRVDIDCRCPPTFTYNAKDKSCDLGGENTFMIHRLPVLIKKYKTVENEFNKKDLNIDVSKSMQQAFANIDFAHVFNFKVEGEIILCDVWLQFSPNLPPAFNASLEIQRWKKLTIEGQDELLLPPGLLLSSSRINSVSEEELTLCTDSVKQSVCGSGATCSDSKCGCKSGYREIESTIRTFANKKRVVRCEDIDECSEENYKHNCTENSKCVNTPGDYFCQCNPGFQKAGEDANALNKDPCIGLCDSTPCKNKGTCQVNKDKKIDCTCQVGYTGSFCEKADVNLAKAGKATKVVGAVLGTLLAIVIILIIIYIVRQRKNSYSEDFTPAPRVDNAEMIERRPMRGVTNRAYQ